MTNKPSPQDIFDIDKRTGALILGSNRLDDYATKYLTKHCKEALLEPMPLPVEAILEREGLTVVEETLSNTGDIFGCCLLLDSEVPVYDKKSQTYKTKKFRQGTILIDPDSETRLDEGAKRNTLVHEALHWEKDKKFFQIKALKEADRSTSVSPFLCKTSESFLEPTGKTSKKNQLRWLEWQAHRLTPRILMPWSPFRKKALEVIQGVTGKESDITRTGICDHIVESLSKFFVVSRASVKYRLLEVGLEKELTNFSDYDVIFGSINNKGSFTKLTPSEAFSFVEQNPLIASWIHEQRFIFAEGYFILADPKYIDYADGAVRLKRAAKNNLSKCAININSQFYRSYKHLEKDLCGLTYLYRTTEIDTRLLTFHPEYQPDLSYSPDEAYESFAGQLFDCEDDIEFQRMLSDPTISLSDCLKYLMELKGIKYPEQFEERTHLNKNYHGRIKNNQANNFNSDTLMAVCVGLGLGLRTTQKLYDKSEVKLDEYNEPDRTRIKILESMPGLSITDFNSVLAACGLDELGSKMRS